MAKAAKKETVETGFSFEELSEEIVRAMGGVGELAKMFVEGAKSEDSLHTKAKYIEIISRIMRQAMPRQEATDGLNDDEIERALSAEITRHFVSMDEDDYRATIERIETARKNRAGQEQRPQGVQQSQKVHPATHQHGSTGQSGRVGEAGQEQAGNTVESNPTAASDRDAAVYQRFERGE